MNPAPGEDTTGFFNTRALFRTLVKAEKTAFLLPDRVNFWFVGEEFETHLPEHSPWILNPDVLLKLVFVLYLLAQVWFADFFNFTKVAFVFCMMIAGKITIFLMGTMPDAAGFPDDCKRKIGDDMFNLLGKGGGLNFHNDFFGSFGKILAHRGAKSLLPTSDFCGDMMWSGHTAANSAVVLGLYELWCLACVLNMQNNCLRSVARGVLGGAFVLYILYTFYAVIAYRHHLSMDVVVSLVVTFLAMTNPFVNLVADWWAYDVWRSARDGWAYDEDAKDHKNSVVGGAVRVGPRNEERQPLVATKDLEAAIKGAGGYVGAQQAMAATRFNKHEGADEEDCEKKIDEHDYYVPIGLYGCWPFLCCPCQKRRKLKTW